VKSNVSKNSWYVSIIASFVLVAINLTEICVEMRRN
jgi:hypothetical protein